MRRLQEKSGCWWGKTSSKRQVLYFSHSTWKLGELFFYGTNILRCPPKVSSKHLRKSINIHQLSFDVRWYSHLFWWRLVRGFPSAMFDYTVKHNCIWVKKCQNCRCSVRYQNWCGHWSTSVGQVWKARLHLHFSSGVNSRIVGTPCPLAEYLQWNHPKMSFF